MADTADRVARIPIADRPRFARKMIAVWRLHHLAAGEDLAVLVPPGEWPDDVEPQVKGVPVVQTAGMGGDGSVVVIGPDGGPHGRAARHHHGSTPARATGRGASTTVCVRARLARMHRAYRHRTQARRRRTR